LYSSFLGKSKIDINFIITSNVPSLREARAGGDRSLVYAILLNTNLIRIEMTKVVSHLLGKTGWLTVVVIGTRQIPNGNFHGDTLIQCPRLFSGSKEIIEGAWN